MLQDRESARMFFGTLDGFGFRVHENGPKADANARSILSHTS